MHLSALGGLCLFFLPLNTAFHGPPHGIARDMRRDELNAHARAIPILDPGNPTGTTTTATTSEPPPQTTPTTTSTPATSTPATTSTPSTTSTSTSAPSSTTHAATSSTRAVTTDDDGVVHTVTVIASDTPTSASATTTTTTDDDSSSSGPGKGTFIGLGVAGGIAVIALIGFIVWKFTQKRFSSFDDDGADINWPMPKEELAPPAAPSMNSAAHATSSSVDLTADPYAVPPLPPRTTPYYDDPSGTASAAYYDPYRGPVPQTFHSPPGSTEGHVPQYAMGEAIPMSTYASSTGRQSPGPNAAYQDPYSRSRSPGPNMGYDDPYAGRRSPGPSLAYGMDPARVGTPPVNMMAPPRMGTPLGGGYGGPGGPPGLDVPRTGTPQSYGRASPGIPPGYQAQQPLVNPYGRSTPNPYGP